MVNHYAFKSEDDFLLRVQRGTEGQFSSQALWQQKYESGAHRKILDAMSEVEDAYLRDFSFRRFGDPRSLTPPRGVVPPVETVRARHRHWQADLMLGANGRVRHAQHGSLGAYRRDARELRVKWDKWPDEDVFVECDGVFSSAEALLPSEGG